MTTAMVDVRRKRRELNTHRGIPNRVDAGPAREHLTILRETMSWVRVAEATGCSGAHLRGVADGSRTRINSETHRKIMRVQPERKRAPGMYIDATGSRRRVQALQANGHSMRAIARSCGAGECRIRNVVIGQERVRQMLADKIAYAYLQLAGTQGTASESRNRAARAGWAPPAAWNDDEIDNPDALPDWTGYCGSDRGWWSHRLMRKDPCPRCQAAHADWLAERKTLEPSVRFKELAAARAEASNRGAAIAEDARELFRQGLDRQGIAERLGIGPSHLDHELARHPELDEPADDQATAA